MEVALVNTNRYLEPPVIPVGVEYLVAPLEIAGHAVDVLDLAFTGDPVRELVSFLDSMKHDVIGFSVRNVDTAILGSSDFFLDGVKDLVAAARAVSGKPVVVGGSATHCSGEALLEFLGADYLVSGPGETAFPLLLDALGSGRVSARIIDGWAHPPPAGIVHPRGRSIDFRRYLDGGHPAGIEFRKGCNWGCAFCVERARPLVGRDLATFIEEARAIAEAGAESAFLCDSEVNLDTGGTRALLSALAEEDLGLEWHGYFRPSPFDPLTARLTRDAGFRDVTLWVCSRDLSSGEGPYSSPNVSAFIESCRDEGIGVAVDLLVGLPGESLESVERALELLAASEPATVGVTSHVRLYEATPVTHEATVHPGRFTGDGDSSGYLRPVFYTNLDDTWLAERISKESLFVIEGTSGTVNYQRLSEGTRGT